MRLRLSPISGIMRGKNGQSVLDLVNVITKSKEMHPKFAGKYLIRGVFLIGGQRSGVG